MRRPNLGLLSLLALGAALAEPHPDQRRTGAVKAKEPRKFTDARIAEAQAKRQRKQAKRMKHHGDH